MSELSTVVQRVANVPTTAMIGAVMAVKEVALAEAVRVAGSDRRLSKVGKSGVRLNVRDKNYGASAVVFAVPAGPWSWMEKGTAPHVIGFGRAARSRGRVGNYRQAGSRMGWHLQIGGTQWVTGPVFHPGTNGKQAWTNVVTRSRPIVNRIFSDALDEAVAA